MQAIDTNMTVGKLVADNPARARVFEEVGIDYCCGGGVTLEQACQKKQLAADDIIEKLKAVKDADQLLQDEQINPASLTLTELADHIQQTHHRYLLEQIPRLQQMANKVAQVHGDKNAKLIELASAFESFSQEIMSHMQKEEQILFPLIGQLEQADCVPQFHCGTVANPIRVMEQEHEQAGGALESFRQLTDDYTPPQWACNTYRVLLHDLADLEKDMHQHIHKENNILFPRAIEKEMALGQ